MKSDSEDDFDEPPPIKKKSKRNKSRTVSDSSEESSTDSSDSSDEEERTRKVFKKKKSIKLMEQLRTKYKERYAAKYRKKKKISQEKIRAKEDLISQLKDQLDDAREKIKYAKQEAIESIHLTDETKIEMEKQIHSLSMDLKKSEASKNWFADELKKIEKNKTENKDNKDKMASEINQYKHLLKEMRIQLDTSDKNLEKSNEENDGLRRQIKDICSSNAETECSFREENKKLKKINQKVVDLTEKNKENKPKMAYSRDALLENCKRQE